MLSILSSLDVSFLNPLIKFIHVLMLTMIRNRSVAYMLTGTAIRMAFAMSLHVESAHDHLPYDVDEIRRTYWTAYLQEVELGLDLGLPISFSKAEMNVPYPKTKVRQDNPSSTRKPGTRYRPVR